MDSMLSRTPVRRSPSPVLPGAWPLNVNTPNSIHKRSNTCPALCNILSKPPNGLVSLPYPLHLDHVRDFQQRLSLSLSRPSDPCDIPNVATAFLPSELASSDSGLSGPGSIPSDGSDLTRWNPNDASASFSAFADTSVDTAYTAHSTSQGFLPLKLPQSESKPQESTQYDRNAHDGTYTVRLNTYSSRPQSSNLVQDNLDSLNKNQAISFVPTSASSQHQARTQAASSHTPSSYAPSPVHLRSNTPSPTASSISPILFSSPTTLGNVSPLLPSVYYRNRSISFEYSRSPSWKTLYGSDFNDEDMLRIDTPPSPRPPASPETNTLHFTTNNRTPSLDIDLQTVPMLTALSLPGSVDSSFGGMTNSNLQDVAQTDEGTPWTLSLPPMSPSLSESFLQISPISQSLSSSPRSAVLNTRGEVCVLEFPSPSLSLSPFTSRFPSPIVEPPTPENASISQTGATEYATALLSSVWGAQGDQIAVRAPGEQAIPVIDAQPTTDVTAHLISREETRANHNHGRNSAETRHTGGIIIIIKKFGVRVKKFMQGKLRGPRTGVDVNITRSRPSMRTRVPINNTQNSAAVHIASTQSSLEFVRISQDSQTRLSLPVPPGLLPRPRRTRLSLTDQTYASPCPEFFAEVTDSGPTSLSAIRDYPIEPGPDGEPQVVRPTIKEFGIEARPKTLAEIKSRRRFSLPAISQFSRSSNPANSSIIPMARPRPRPVSTVSFNVRPPSYTVDEDSFRNTSTRPRGMLSDVAATADRGGIQVVPPLPRSTAQPMNTTVSASEECRPRNAVLVKKKRRRMSLSALSLSRNRIGMITEA